ncbi:MAG TPA: nicotinate-nucleotide adenylyltransferase [Gammaproteobacteria bacterium]|nr:nicotinate-nucleotide adenylyltransferase [Gammaproteobacteria bacterium]
MSKPVGILGGTFDPFHHGHLRLAIECREKLQLQSVQLIPLYTPPHRETPVASTVQRLAMLTLAIRDHDFLQIDVSELQRRGISYTIETIKGVRDRLEDTPLCLLMGRDAFNSLGSWHDWRHLIDYTHIVVADRPGKPSGKNDTDLADFIRHYRTDDMGELHNLVAGKLFELTIPLLDISATQIRKIIQAGNDPAGLLPQTVIDYIHTHSLYQQDNS